ncbi:hypothetical protein CDAR_619951 [Caerostris darwini]|uniref:Uncharacterized protein n=1 Tax=Caerostris darwini TaxID=1538125 RepID=A0AAV4PEP0_9ARAC|nr:hypothetical protein CDAR_619951 [Caerostris darwini]
MIPILSTSYIQRSRDPWKIGEILTYSKFYHTNRYPLESTPATRQSTSEQELQFQDALQHGDSWDPKEAILTQEPRRSEAGDETSQATSGHHRCLRPVLAALRGSVCCDGSL